MKTQPGIFRAKMKFEKDFVIIPNHWLRDPNISYKAKGLLAYLYSHEPGYTIRFRQIISQTQDGERSVRAAMTELKKAGYLETQRTTDDRGYNAGLNYLLVDPAEPKLHNPTLDNPTLDNAVALENNSTENTTKEKKDDGVLFEQFWSYYPKKVARADAVKAWNRAIKRKPADDIIRLAKDYSEGKLPASEYIPNGSTWLNNNRWEDVETQKNKTLPKLRIGLEHE